MRKLKLGELFAGFGGLGMAVEEVFDAELTWYAEFDDAPSKIMAHHWPGIPNHRDVTTVDWSQVEPVDIISGGSPCQDLSAAGRRAGMTEGTRSNLWVSMREAIATIKPTYVVWENVRGAYSAKASSASDLEPADGSVGVGAGDNLRALGRVLGDLADLGYDCQWRGLRAADVGAPHGRFRVFILATQRGAKPSDADHAGLEGQRDSSGTAPSERHRHTGACSDGTATDTNDERSDGRGERTEQDRWGEPADSGHVTADPEHDGHASSAGGRSDGTTVAPRSRSGSVQAKEHGEPTRGHLADSEPGRVQTKATPEPSGNGRNERRPESEGLQGRSDATKRSSSHGINWGVYAPAIRRWEALRGTAPAPTELTAKGKHRLNAAFAEWMMGLAPGHVTDVPGLTRNEELKAIGNGVVPQQAIAALKHMLGAS